MAVLAVVYASHHPLQRRSRGTSTDVQGRLQENLQEDPPRRLRHSKKTQAPHPGHHTRAWPSWLSFTPATTPFNGDRGARPPTFKGDSKKTQALQEDSGTTPGGTTPGGHVHRRSRETPRRLRHHTTGTTPPIKVALLECGRVPGRSRTPIDFPMLRAARALWDRQPAQPKTWRAGVGVYLQIDATMRVRCSALL
jgi:hypothetical protein